MSARDPQPPAPPAALRTRAAVILKRYGWAAAIAVTISFLHYGTAVHIHALHGIYRRLYYFPIILGGFRGGVAGGLLMSGLVIALYLPHALGWIGLDPGTMVEKVLECVLYLAVGLLTGILVSRLEAARARLARAIADLQDALAQRSAMQGELVRAARLAAVGRLSAGLAHEIRNPLASIRGSAEVLADDFPPGHPKARLLDILQQETGRLGEVLTRFLAFARTQPGPPVRFPLEDEARAVADLVAHRPRDPILVQVQAPPQPCLVAADRAQVRQVLLNLVLNAAAAAGPAGKVTIDLRPLPGACACRVLDSGPGFTAEALANFGTPFFSTTPGGTGLGLATSLRIVEDLGGTLAAEGGRGCGGCVTMTLPAAAADAPASSRSPGA